MRQKMGITTDPLAHIGTMNLIRRIFSDSLVVFGWLGGQPNSDHSFASGAKTAITGGSVPRTCDRPTVVISTQRLQKILPIGPDAKQVLCFAGAGIFSVQETLLLGCGNLPWTHFVLREYFLDVNITYIFTLFTNIV